jgi:hypothetical protein
VLRCAGDPNKAAVFVGLGGVVGVPMTAVVLVPKTVSAELLGAALGPDVPTDGSRDVLILGEGEDFPVTWPLLVVDALALVNTAAAAQL